MAARRAHTRAPLRPLYEVCIGWFLFCHPAHTPKASATSIRGFACSSVSRTCRTGDPCADSCLLYWSLRGLYYTRWYRCIVVRPGMYVHVLCSLFIALVSNMACSNIRSPAIKLQTLCNINWVFKSKFKWLSGKNIMFHDGSAWRIQASLY